MKQSTLKRPAPSSVPSRKKVQTIQGAGTSTQPIGIDLDSKDSPIDLDSTDNEEDDEQRVLEPQAGSSQTSNTSALVSSKPSLPSSGPTTSNPLNINEPDFDVRDTFADVKPQVILKDPGLDLLYFKRMITGKQLFEYLLNELPWYRVTYPIRGITIRTPRWTCVWGCDETGAPLSSYKMKPRKIPSVLQQLLEHMQEQTNAKFNFVLVNYYENGKDSISWHNDGES